MTNKWCTWCKKKQKMGGFMSNMNATFDIRWTGRIKYQYVIPVNFPPEHGSHTAEKVESNLQDYNLSHFRMKEITNMWCFNGSNTEYYKNTDVQSDWLSVIINWEIILRSIISLVVMISKRIMISERRQTFLYEDVI